MALPAVLYVSYDGMLEPLGQSQVIAYLEGLTDTAAFHLISYEKPADWHDSAKRDAIAARLHAAGIVWHPLRYHKSPSVPATLYDIMCGTLLALYLTLRHRIRFVHARSYIPALIGRVVKALTGAKLLFDMRGLWADERVDGGIWPKDGRVFRTVKGLEKGFLLHADQVVTLTHASAEVIAAFPYLAGRPLKMSVIPTCADLDLFRPERTAPPATFTLGYLGSVGTWYLFDEVLEIFRLLRARGPAKLLVINRHERDFITGRIAAFDIDPTDVEITAVAHREVPQQIARMSVGAAIIKPIYSKIASAPTKLAEYLGCGVPCLGNTGVGDMEAILEGEKVGVALTDFSPADRAGAVDRLLALVADPEMPARCRAVAEKLFSLDQGVIDYRAIYRELLA